MCNHLTGGDRIIAFANYLLNSNKKMASGDALRHPEPVHSATDLERQRKIRSLAPDVLKIRQV